MDYKLLRSDARERLKGNWTTAVLAFLVYSAIVSAVEGAGLVLGDFLSILSTIAFVVIYGPLQYGMSNIFLKLNRKEKTEVGDLFVGFSDNMSQKISAGVSIYVYTFLWSLLLIIPGIVAAYSYSLTYYIIKDNPNINSNEAITRSKNIMNGHKWELFCLDLTFIGWMFLSILTLGIGLFWLIPYMQATRARFYEELVGAPVVAEEGVQADSEQIIKNEDEVKPYSPTDDANEVYTLVCETCGARDTHTLKTSTCPYCGGKMKSK